MIKDTNQKYLKNYLKLFKWFKKLFKNYNKFNETKKIQLWINTFAFVLERRDG